MPDDPNPAATPDGAGPDEPGSERAMFDKPNLQLRDPDPYAFANRIRRLLILGSVLACLAAAPFFSRIFAYQIRRGQMQAEVEIASEALGDLAPQLTAFEEASRLVAKKVGPSVVSVFKQQRRNQFGANGEGQGSGFIIDPDGYIITNEHVVRNAETLMVQFSNGELADASIVGVDPPTDLAVLKVTGADLPALEWADSDRLQMGNLVWAVGSPFGLENSITFGIVSSTSRRSQSGVTGNTPYQEFFQSDAAVNPGNSGGPMVNLSGQVVGVNTAILGRSYRGVSLSIPSNFAEQKYLQLREKGFIERGYLGVSPREPNEVVRRRLGLEHGEGVVVTNMRSVSPAAVAGLKNNDVILKWNDHNAIDPTLLSREIAATEVGAKVPVLVRRLERDGSVVDKELLVEVGLHPNTDRR